jgi:hypothetical protein
VGRANETSCRSRPRLSTDTPKQLRRSAANHCRQAACRNL